MTLRHFVPNLGTGIRASSQDTPRAKTRDPLTFLDHKYCPVLARLRDFEGRTDGAHERRDVLVDILVAGLADRHSAICYRHRNLLGEKREFSGSTTEVKPVAPDC